MIEKVIYFLDQPLDDRNLQRFGMRVLERNGFEVEVWDFTPFLYPKAGEAYEPVDYGRCRLFSSADKARAAIAGLGNSTVVFCLVGYNPGSIGIYRALSRTKVPYAVMLATAYPGTPQRRSILTRVRHSRSKFSRRGWQRLRETVLDHLPFRFLGIRSADLLLAAAEGLVHANLLPVDKRTKIVWLHHLDYDTYLRVRDIPGETNVALGVFLDEYLPYHPDFTSVLGIAAPVAAEEYYGSLRRCFDDIEASLGVRVEVAAHPRSNYEANPTCYGGRPAMRGRTPEMVKQAHFVIAHCSLSTNYAVLFQKPVIFLTSNALRRSFEGEMIDRMASLLGKQPINVDEIGEVDWAAELAIDEQAYLHYRNAYLKKDGSADLPFWQAVADHVRDGGVE